MKNKKVLANTLLLITAIIWGSAFVAQKEGMNYVSPFTFNFARFALSTLVLLPVVYFMEKAEQSKRKNTSYIPEVYDKKTFFIASLVCGTFLFAGSSLQQFGLIFTTAGKSAFITTLYILLVPIFGLFFGHRINGLAWIAVIFGTVGLYFLCITESFTIGKGDFIVLIGAFFWTSHVLSIDRFLPKVNGVRLAMAQFAVCGLWSLIAAFLFETPNWQAIYAAGIPILYAGIMSGGVGYTFQILGQKYTTPTVASLLMSMESVFAVIAGYFLLNEIMTGREFFGSILMFIAIIISQIPESLFRWKKKSY